jgi:pimeloyl-ACP methyl ester carboxylesterase
LDRRRAWVTLGRRGPANDARRLRLLFETLGLERYALVAQDTGATLARLVALGHPERVDKRS